jgi:hypothetical protein
MYKDYFAKPGVNPNERRVMLSVLSDKWAVGIMDWLTHLSGCGASFEACQLFWKAADLYQQQDREDLRTMRLLTKIKACRFKRNGHWVMWVYQWGRDCDLFESDSISTIPANLAAFNEFEDSMYNNAEGPCSCSIMTEAAAADYQPYWRDIAAEQMGY